MNGILAAGGALWNVYPRSFLRWHPCSVIWRIPWIDHSNPDNDIIWYSIVNFSMTPNGAIEIKTLEMTNDCILIKFMGLFKSTASKTYINLQIRYLEKCLWWREGWLSYVFESYMQPINNCGGDPPPPPPNNPPPSMGNYPSWFMICGMVQVEAMVYVFLILSTGSLLPLPYSHGHALWFLPFFSIFLTIFLSRLW